MKDIEYQLLSAFSGVGCKGSPHRVIINSGAIDEAQYLDYSSEVSPDIVVVIPEEQINSTDISPRIFHHGQEVLFCGSGAMACAWMLYSRLEQQEPLQNNPKFKIHLPNKDLSVLKTAKGLSMEVNAALQAKRVRIGPWEAILRHQVLDSVEVAAHYVIVEIESAAELRYLRPNLKQLCRYTNKALIVTALGRADYREDYCMRYFAPQFGNDEDSATASANSYLMKYWQLKLNKNRLQGRQLSNLGALFSGTVRGSHVSLSGKFVART
ncbi:PhzF family phenazine biosynthesis protein [Agaribacterium sp. ZY112]|uniref:PhzF family phenazine biosynthesis protein n=1 Tax=Agaribacterium sp. ZY112 TaxID=3233574 RepID=UPI003523566C